MRLSLVCGATAFAQTACAVQPNAATTQGAFTGTWTVQWCNKAWPSVECGGFTVDLWQRGDRICGSHGAATPGLSRVDEGKARSIVGMAVGPTAVLTVRSGRSGGVSLVTVKRQPDALQWTRTETITDGLGSDDLIAAEAVLKRARPSEAAQQQFDVVRTSCNAYWDASPD